MPSFASLFLILTFAALAILNRSQGLPLDLASVNAWCGDNRIVVAIIHQDGSLALNAEPQKTIESMRARLFEIFETRAERVVFLQVESNVPFREVATVIDAIRPAADIVSLITRHTQRQPNFAFCLAPSRNAEAALLDRYDKRQ